MTGQATDIETLLAGMLVLVLAVFAWPAVARFFTFASVQVAGGSGLGTLLGFAAGRASGGGGGPAGVEPSEFSRRAEQRTMAAQGEGMASGGAAGGGLPGMVGAGTPKAGAGATGGAAAAGTATGGVAAVAIAGAKMAQQAVNSLTGHMEQMAGHAGMQGANPYAQPAGTPRSNQAASSQHPAPSPQETGQPAPDPGTPPAAPVPPPPDLNIDDLPAVGPPVDDTPHEMPESTGEAGAS
jgi:hypothetical protein